MHYLILKAETTTDALSIWGRVNLTCSYRFTKYLAALCRVRNVAGRRWSLQDGFSQIVIL